VSEAAGPRRRNSSEQACAAENGGSGWGGGGAQQRAIEHSHPSVRSRARLGDALTRPTHAEPNNHPTQAGQRGGWIFLAPSVAEVEGGRQAAVGVGVGVGMAVPPQGDDKVPRLSWSPVARRMCVAAIGLHASLWRQREEPKFPGTSPRPLGFRFRSSASWTSVCLC
jgi:hypothetical protein